MLTERNPDTTKWPKMDITNCRSMELLKRLGVADGLRAVGKYLLPTFTGCTLWKNLSFMARGGEKVPPSRFNEAGCADQSRAHLFTCSAVIV